MKKLKIKKGATVEVIAGSEKGKRGAVLDVDREKLKVRVQGVRVQTHFDQKEGMQTQEGFIDYSNVKLVEQASEQSAQKKKKKKKKAAARS